MQVISWEEYLLGISGQGSGIRVDSGNRDQGSGIRVDSGNREQGSGIRGCCSRNARAYELVNRSLLDQPPFPDPRSPIPDPRPPIPDPRSPIPELAVTIGVFDGVHLGHQALINKICSLAHNPQPLVPTVVTFSQNPVQVLGRQQNHLHFEILNLEQKLNIFRYMGVQLTVLIDFSEKFSKIYGGDFIKLLLKGNSVKMIALGENFRCGYKLDTGTKEISSIAAAQGVETWVLPPVMDEGQPVSSSRIRQAIASGRMAEAERLLGRSIRN